MSGPCTYCCCPAGKYKIEVPASSTSVCSECAHGLEHHSDLPSIEQAVIAITRPLTPTPVRLSPPPTLRPEAFVHKPFNLQASIYRRSDFVDGFVQRLLQLNFLTIRGTPAIGKTTLMELAVNKLLNDYPSLPIYVLTGWNRDSVVSSGGWSSYLRLKTGIDGNSWRNQKAVLFLDEGQTSYWDNGGLWQRFFKMIQKYHPEGPFVAVFSSYGSPGGGYAGFDFTQCRFEPTPLRNKPPQEIVIWGTSGSEVFAPIGLLLGKSSIHFLEHILEYHKVTFEPDLKNEIVSISGGHAGIIKALIETICYSTPIIRTQIRMKTGPITFASVREEILLKPKHLFQCLQASVCNRGFPPEGSLRTPEVSKAFELLILGSGEATAADLTQQCGKEVAASLVENGWAHPEEDETGLRYMFVTRIHQWYCAYRLLLLRDPPAQFENVQQLTLASIQRFSVNQLRDPPRSNYPNALILEDQYQKELYRVLFKFGILVSPEYTIKVADGKHGGRVDFKFGDSNWAVELVRQENDLQGHMDRFERGGKYYKEVAAGNIKDWVVVNLTQTPVSKLPGPHEDNVRLLHAIFSQDFSEVEYVQGDGKNLGRFRLVV